MLNLNGKYWTSYTNNFKVKGKQTLASHTCVCGTGYHSDVLHFSTTSTSVPLQTSHLDSQPPSRTQRLPRTSPTFGSLEDTHDYHEVELRAERSYQVHEPAKPWREHLRRWPSKRQAFWVVPYQEERGLPRSRSSVDYGNWDVRIIEKHRLMNFNLIHCVKPPALLLNLWNVAGGKM